MDKNMILIGLVAVAGFFLWQKMKTPATSSGVIPAGRSFGSLPGAGQQQMSETQAVLGGTAGIITATGDAIANIFGE